MKRLTNLIAILLFSLNSFAQHFVVAYTGNGQDHMNINIVAANIGGAALNMGDEIAAFDGAVCCGKIILKQPIVFTTPGTFAAIAASRKDDGSANGYTIGHTITYKFWDSGKIKEFSGISAEYLDPVTAQPITAPTYTVNETTFVKLSFTESVNQPPLPNAGPDQSVNENSLFTLDGSASSDPDNNALIYKWTAPSEITLSSTSLAKPTFTAPEVTISTSYTFTLVVNDGIQDSSPDQVIITVKNGNQAPTANAGTDQSVNEGELVTLNGTTSTDPDSDPITYLWTPPAGITLSSNSSSQPVFTAPEVTSDKQYTFSLVVNDGTTNSLVDQVIISVKNVDKVPYVKNSIKNISVDKRSANQIINLKDVFADDDLDDVLSYTINSNSNNKVVTATITGFGLTLIFSAENIGFAEIEITASSNGKVAKSKFQVEVKIPTGVEQLPDHRNMKVYPNPTSGKIKVVFEEMSQNTTTLTVRDETGKTILKKKIQNKEELVDLTGKTPGVYLIQTNKNNFNFQKVILK